MQEAVNWKTRSLSLEQELLRIKKETRKQRDSPSTVETGGAAVDEEAKSDFEAHDSWNQQFSGHDREPWEIALPSKTLAREEVER